MSEEIQIIGKHPHVGERGTIDGAGLNLNGKIMYRVELIDCKHGVEACYAQEQHLGCVMVTPLKRKRTR